MDTRLYIWVNGLTRATPWAHTVLTAYAVWAGLVLLAGMLVGGWAWGRRQPDAPRRFATVLLTGVGVVVAVGLNKAVITKLFDRPRPCTTVHHALSLVPCTPDNAFPSDHALLAGAFAAGLLLLNRALGTVAAVAAVYVAFGRVYIGMHHPGDVAAGLVLGAVITVVVVLALRGVATRLAEALNRTAIGPVIAAREGHGIPAADAVPVAERRALPPPSRETEGGRMPRRSAARRH
ncbi:MAG TPA: phosphatase PAP2 family protein [Streptosporangiaceae bacterium]